MYLQTGNYPFPVSSDNRQRHTSPLLIIIKKDLIFFLVRCNVLGFIDTLSFFFIVIIILLRVRKGKSKLIKWRKKRIYSMFIKIHIFLLLQ